jgi:endonuclease/exonuclease/phosphatase family metal-dependent hydrolase
MPDIVALQDVSRGWVTNGGLDMLAWLSYRLNMTYVFEPTTDPLSGNAILSRYPITAYTQESLPPADSLIKRGFVTALINVTEGQYMKVLTTQLDAAEANSDIRQLQAQIIIDRWGGIDSTAILGNFNAEPSSPEIYKLYYAQLHDFFISQKTAYTFPSNNPWKRIDYILTSPDLRVTDGGVSQSTASNHLPVVAVIDR